MHRPVAGIRCTNFRALRKEEKGMYNQTSYHRDNHPRGSGLILMLLLLFVVTGIYRGTTPEERAETFAKRQALLNDADGIKERFFHLSDSLCAGAREKGDAYSCGDFVQARNLLFALSDSMSQLSANGMPPSTISFLLNEAEDNCRRNREVLAFQMSEAESQYGIPLTIETERPTVTGTLNFFGKVVLHMFWFGLFVVPFVLVMRALIAHKFSRDGFMWVFSHPVWLVTCSMLWFCICLKYGDKEPRVTAKFFLLRFQYMWNERKFFLTVAENEALLQSAGEPAMNIDSLVSFVHERLAFASDAGKRLAMVAFFTALFSFSGYLIASMNQQGSESHAALEYFRLQSSYVDGSWSLTSQLNLIGTPLVKYAFVGYDMPELAGIHPTLHAGRVVAPWCWGLLPANVSPFVETPFDGRLDVPFFDNCDGAVLTLERGSATARFALTNGCSDFVVNDNDQMDYSLRLSYSITYGTISGSYQKGCTLTACANCVQSMCLAR